MTSWVRPLRHQGPELDGFSTTYLSRDQSRDLECFPKVLLLVTVLLPRGRTVLVLLSTAQVSVGSGRGTGEWETERKGSIVSCEGGHIRCVCRGRTVERSKCLRPSLVAVAQVREILGREVVALFSLVTICLFRYHFRLSNNVSYVPPTLPTTNSLLTTASGETIPLETRLWTSFTSSLPIPIDPSLRISAPLSFVFRPFRLHTDHTASVRSVGRPTLSHSYTPLRV